MTAPSLSEAKSGLEQTLDKETLSQVLKSATRHEEIERKFVVSNPPENLELYEKEEIEQHYLPVKGDSEVRIRSADGKYYITEKSGAGIKRDEIEAEILKDTFESLKSKALSSLRKTRYIIPASKGKKIEINVHKEQLNGLNVVEVEFESLKEAYALK